MTRSFDVASDGFCCFCLQDVRSVVFNDVVYTASVKLPGYRKSEKSQVGKLGILLIVSLDLGFAFIELLVVVAGS